MDHSGSLPDNRKTGKKRQDNFFCREEKKRLIKHFGHEFDRVETVKTGDELKLGKKTLRFLETPMLHWPDSMFTYLVEDKILMPNDAFGQHLASSGRFDDEVDKQCLMEEAETYYANILMPFAPLITRKIQEVVQMGHSHRHDCPRPRHNLAKRPYENHQRLPEMEFRRKLNRKL